MAELKTCPFCGGEAHLCEDYSSELDERRYNVWHECEGFEGESNGYGYSLHPWFETPWYRDKATALAAWNRRQMAELKTCPFCGSGALYEARHTVDWFDMPFIFCDTCKAMFTVEGSEDWIHGDHDGMAELRAAWNNRDNSKKEQR